MTLTFNPEDSSSRFSCPLCDHVIQLAGTFSGKRISCPECREDIEIPKPVAAVGIPTKTIPETKNLRKGLRIGSIVALSIGILLIVIILAIAIPILLFIIDFLETAPLP